MRRAVLDPGVFVSALLNLTGTPALLLAQAHGAGFELVVSPMLLKELETVLLRKKFRRLATVAPHPDKPAPLSCPDPKDDYLLALAYAQKATLVSGDSDLLEIVSGAPILAPADLLAR